MKISFKDTDDKNSCEIFINDVFIGDVRFDVLSRRWSMYPNFKISYYNAPETKKDYFSSYEAGKELVKLYQFVFPEYDEQETQELGFSLDDVLAFLKNRR